MTIARDAGVEFEFEAAVNRIDVDGNCARGITMDDGRRLPADAVVANADLPYVYHNLLPEHDIADQMAHKQFSCSVIIFFWGIDKTYPILGPHTLFLADDYRENFESITHRQELPGNPSLYVHAPARLDTSMAPQGQDTLIAIVPVGHLHEGTEQDWESIRDRARRAVFKRLSTLGITDLEAHIKFEVNYTPLSWRKRYNLMNGSTHGLSHTLTQLGYFRPHNQHHRYQSLFFVGASTHPGTGVPTALISGHHAADRVMAQLAARS